MSVLKDRNGTYKVLYYHIDFDGKRNQTTKRGFTKKSEAVFFNN